MSNGDPLAIGITAPPYNRCDSGTFLYQQGSPFGTQNAALWVRRDGAPICGATIRGDNFSSPPTPGVLPAGVMGMVAADDGGVGVLGTASASQFVFGEIGVLGVTNSFGVVGRALTGAITTAPGVFISGTGVVGTCDDGVGVHGSATTGWGVIGDSSSGAGVTATSDSGVGIDARSQNSTAVLAVAGGSGAGVLGQSSGGPGVEGFTAGGVAGVHGHSERCGVWGEGSGAGVGVYGTSPGNAVVGVTSGSSATSAGVVGSSARSQGVLGTSTIGIGVVGRSRRGLAGSFEGDVVVQGAFYVSGLKAAAVTHPDGSHRAMFSLEAPESYFEDFGEVTLIGESVVVSLDADFAALVTRKKYQVFLTSYGPEALYVRRRDADGFEIARVDAGDEGKLRRVQVGYRIVARRADVKAGRLPKVKMPARSAEMVTDVLPPGGVAAAGRRSVRGADHRQPRGRVTAVPSTPKVPSPDLAALFDATPVERGPEEVRQRPTT
jgi:hypothetical protein